MNPLTQRFLAHYYSRRPVNATFTGVHDFDRQLPDWSASGRLTLDAEMRSLRTELAASATSATGGDAVDHELAASYLDTQLAESAGGHGTTANPALWTGEAIFGAISLMIRDFATVDERRTHLTARLDAVPAFLQDARAAPGDQSIPAPWSARALRDCDGAEQLLGNGVALWLSDVPGDPAIASRMQGAAVDARSAFATHAAWLHRRVAAPDAAASCGPAMFDTLLTRGHHVHAPRTALLRSALAEFEGARELLAERCRVAGGDWATVSARVAADHPSPADYLTAFATCWESARARAVAADLVEWPDWPIRYEIHPAWTADAAPHLYYLHYRSPAPFDRAPSHRYTVPALPLDPAAHLRSWNRTTILLNHVVHHGGLGHHVQNWHAYHRAESPVAQVAAVDCANRIGMFGAGTMAEGWACYATDLMDEIGALSPLERAAEQHSRLRQLARAIVDIRLHTEGLSTAEAIRFYQEEAGFPPAAARGEVAKNAMFPCTAVMYWLGTREIHDWRADVQRQQRGAFSLRRFHDRLLANGSIPVALARRLSSAELRA